jgi:hypothetical protein
VPEMLRLVEKMHPDAQTTIDSNGCILVKEVMRRIIPQGQILPEHQ